MTTTIHMDSEIISSYISNASSAINEMESSLQKMNSMVKSISLEGQAWEQFFSNFFSLYNQMVNTLDTGRQITIRVQHELEEWLTVDQHGVDNLASVSTAVTGFGRFLGDNFNAYWLSLTRSQYEKSFSAWWDGQTAEEKQSFLKKQADEIAKDLGLDPVEMHFIQIDDPAGKDAQGYYDGTGIYIDTDNLESDKPWALLNTIAHECRHAHQDNAVDILRETGKPPEGISRSTVESWQKNYEDYITPDEDFEGYRGQPIEVDARDYGGKYADRVLIDQPWKEE